MDWQAARVTLRLAMVTTMILLAMAVPLGYWLATSRARWKPLAEAAVALPLVLPPTVLGYYLLVALGRRSWLPPLAFSFTGLVMGSVIFSLPFAVQPIAAGMRSIDPELIETATVLTARRGRIFTRVLLPLLRPALITSTVLTFTHTVGEFGVVLMIGGGIPGVTRTLSIALYDQVQGFAYTAANQTAVVLVAMSFAALVGVYGRR